MEHALVERLLSFWSFPYDFVVRLTVASVVAGLLCGVLGTHLVLRRLSLLGDVLGHAAWPGVVIAFWLAGGASLWLLPWAVSAALVAAWVVAWLVRQPGVRPDAAMAIVLATAFGLGSVLWSWAQRSGSRMAGAQDALLGNAAAITTPALWALVVLALLVLAALVLAHGRWVGWLMDAEWAASVGWKTVRLERGLILLLALTVVVSAPVLGVLLVTAMLVLPASTALLLSRSLPTAMGLAAFVGAVTGLMGAWLSFALVGVATGPAIVLVGALIFVLVRLVHGRHDGLA